MPDRIRFHLDEHIPRAVVEGLRRRGIDVTTSVEMDLVGRTDEEQLTAAREGERVFVTHDADFVALHRSGMQHAGIAFCQQRGRTFSDILRGLILVWEVLSPQEMRNHIEFL